MRSALFFAFTGSALSIYLGARWLGWTPGHGVLAVLVSNLSGFLARLID